MNTLLDFVKYQTLVILKTTSIHGIPNHPIIISLYSNYAIDLYSCTSNEQHTFIKFKFTHTERIIAIQTEFTWHCLHNAFDYLIS